MKTKEKKLTSAKSAQVPNKCLPLFTYQCRQPSLRCSNLKRGILWGDDVDYCENKNKGGCRYLVYEQELAQF